MDVGTAQIKEEIAAHPFFQGPMTKPSYEAFLRAQGINGVQLEQMTRQQVIGKQLENVLRNGRKLLRRFALLLFLGSLAQIGVNGSLSQCCRPRCLH